MNINQSRVAFAGWLKRTNRDLYDRAMQNAETWRRKQAKQQGNPATISGLGQTGTGATAPQSFWQQFVSGVMNLATGVLAFKGQKEILEANIKRVEQGLPPIDPATMAPAMRTEIEISPEIAARLQQTASEALPKLLIPVALIGGALLLLGGRRRHA